MDVHFLVFFFAQVSLSFVPKMHDPEAFWQDKSH